VKLKNRIKNVFNNKKPAFWIACAAVIIAAAGVVLLIANPRADDTAQWRPQPEYEDQDEYFKALAEARESDRTEEIAVDDMGDREKTARVWMEAWLGMYKALPRDNMAHIAEWTIDRLDIIRVPKSGGPEAFVFSVTFSVRPTYPIAQNSFWMAENTGESPGRDETWGQMYREVMLRAEDDGKYHFAEMGTGSVGYGEDMEELRGAVDIRWEASDDVPQPVRDYAVDYVREQVEYYNSLAFDMSDASLAFNIIDAKITALTHMNTGTADLTKDIGMWRLEYRLLPDDAGKVVLAGGMKMEDGWLTEWGSTGQPYLVLVCDDTGTEPSWQRVCVTNTDVIKQEYGTPEMLKQYGNEFTAAAMELYRKSLEIRTIGQVPAVYTRKEELGHTAVQKVAELLMAELLNDLKTEQAGRTFVLADWKNLSVSADRMYDAWVVAGDVEVRYEGILSPVGDGGAVPEGEYVRVSLGERYLRHEDGVFTLSLSAGERRAVLEPPLLTPDMSAGIGVIPDYEGGDILIFHGYFGLFVYDLKAEKITFAADLKKAVGSNIIQGSEGAAVRVGADGHTIQLYYYPERGEPKMAYTIDAHTGSYTYGEYEPIDPCYSPPDEMHSRFSGSTLGELSYTDGKKSFLLFANWDWAG
jgi:hypothetical protein